MANIINTLINLYKQGIALKDIVADKTLSIKQFNDTTITDYFRTYLFKVQIVDLDKTNTIQQANSLISSALKFATGNFLSQANFSTSGFFQCEWVANTQTPYSTTTTQLIDYMHTQIKQSGRTTFQQWPITVRDDASGKARAYFEDWRSLVYGDKMNSSKSTLPTRYKRTANLMLISPSTSKTKSFSIHGVWPFEIGTTQLDYESETISTFPVTLSIDYIAIEPAKGIEL